MIESVSLAQGLLIALYGFVTVFIMLSILMAIISILGKIVSSFTKEEKFVVEEAEKEVDNLDLDKEFVGTIQLIDVDEKTAACIMAIISEETKIPLENLIFKKIRLIKEEL